ncbi:porin [Aliihoeflea sp. PC F10.4]
MNIKSLLLGSAAGLVAVSGAQAADAIVYAEPEPVEYVRVCDMYGAGFFYIPGTETCLRIGGEVRYQIGFADDGDIDNYHGFVDDGYNKLARARVFFDARSDTEWGTLRGYIRWEGNAGNDTSVAGRGNGSVNNQRAFIELGGLKMGRDDSLWAVAGGSHSDGGLYYGFQRRQQISYTFTGANGFFAAASVEDNNKNFASLPFAGGTVAYENNGYTPDVVARIGIEQGWGSVWGQVGYDNDRTGGFSGDGFNVYGLGNAAGVGGVPAFDIDQDGWAASIGGEFNIPNYAGSSLRLIGYYADSDNIYNEHGGEWSVLASYYHQFTPTFGASVGGQWISDLYVPGTDLSSGVDAWAVEGNLVWTPVRDFAVRTEVVYTDVDSDVGGNATSGFVRFSRFF